MTRDDLRNDAKRGYIALDSVGPARASAKKSSATGSAKKPSAKATGSADIAAELNALYRLGSVFGFDGLDNEFRTEIEALITRTKRRAEERAAAEAQRRTEEAVRQAEAAR